MKLPRFRVHALLVAVALAGLAMGGYVLWQRSESYEQLSSSYLDYEEDYAEFARESQSEPDRTRFLRWRDYCGALRLKYKRAARYPFLPVVPDPPEPK